MPTRIKTTLPNTEFNIAEGNYDTNRKTINQIIIHTTVSSVQSAIAHFGSSSSGVSAHYIVGLDGKLYHGLEETFVAYHAGDYPINQRSIGIEHEDNGDYNGVRPDALYTASAVLVRDICLFYNIPIDRTHILKHSEVHNTGCPDALDIDRIVQEAAEPVIPPSPDTCAITDQTLIPQIVDDNGNIMEVGAIKSKLSDNARDLTNKNEIINNLSIEITNLRSDLDNCQNTPPPDPCFTPQSLLGKAFYAWAVLFK